jgi:hypothetical protein
VVAHGEAGAALVHTDPIHARQYIAGSGDASTPKAACRSRPEPTTAASRRLSV